MVSTGIDKAISKAPTRKQVAEWTSNALQSLSPDIVRNAWRHDAYTYFPLTAMERPIDYVEEEGTTTVVPV
jgi:hypothetical protein